MGAVVGSGIVSGFLVTMFVLSGSLVLAFIAGCTAICGAILGWPLGRQREHPPRDARVTEQCVFAGLIGAIVVSSMLAPVIGTLAACYAAVVGAIAGVLTGALVGMAVLLLLGGSVLIRRPAVIADLVLRVRLIGVLAAPLAFFAVSAAWVPIGADNLPFHAIHMRWPERLALTGVCAVIGWYVTPRVIVDPQPASDAKTGTTASLGDAPSVSTESVPDSP